MSIETAKVRKGEKKAVINKSDLPAWKKKGYSETKAAPKKKTKPKPKAK